LVASARVWASLTPQKPAGMRFLAGFF